MFNRWGGESYLMMRLQWLTSRASSRFLSTRARAAMQPKLFAATNILARLLIQFATRQGNSYVSVVSSDGTFRDQRFASFLSRHMPTRIIARPSTDKQRLPKSQVVSYLTTSR